MVQVTKKHMTYAVGPKMAIFRGKMMLVGPSIKRNWGGDHAGITAISIIDIMRFNHHHQYIQSVAIKPSNIQ